MLTYEQISSGLVSSPYAPVRVYGPQPSQPPCVDPRILQLSQLTVSVIYTPHVVHMNYLDSTQTIQTSHRL